MGAPHVHRGLGVSTALCWHGVWWNSPFPSGIQPLRLAPAGHPLGLAIGCSGCHLLSFHPVTQSNSHHLRYPWNLWGPQRELLPLCPLHAFWQTSQLSSGPIFLCCTSVSSPGDRVCEAVWAWRRQRGGDRAGSELLGTVARAQLREQFLV